MKAAVYTRYGSPDVVRIEEVDAPVPGDREVLIEVRSASVNPLDWHFLRGAPRVARVVFGLLKPKDPRLGVDVAGRVVAVGPGVTRFAPGDYVFGAGRGAFAEYACASEAALAAKPDGVSFEEAAGAPIAALTALQGLRDHGRLRPGQTVLVNGAAGGVGTFAVQIARALGAEVTGVCSTRNVDLVGSIGASHVVDYTREDFAAGGRKFDLLFDCVGNRAMSEYRSALAPKGIYVGIGGGAPETSSFELLSGIAKRMLLSAFVSQDLRGFTAKPNHQDLATVGELMASRRVRTIIDRRFPLNEVADALRYLETGHASGKVIVAVLAPPTA